MKIRIACLPWQPNIFASNKQTVLQKETMRHLTWDISLVAACFARGKKKKKKRGAGCIRITTLCTSNTTTLARTQGTIAVTQRHSTIKTHTMHPSAAAARQDMNPNHANAIAIHSVVDLDLAAAVAPLLACCSTKNRAMRVNQTAYLRCLSFNQPQYNQTPSVAGQQCT